MKTIKIFDYIKELDCFVASKEYARVAKLLGLEEWNPVVWIGRLFLLDNDFGEHWFDNWELREEKKAEAEALGIAYDELLIIDPERFQNGADGPCNSSELRKLFWTDVLNSLTLSHDLLFAKARENNEQIKTIFPEEYISDLEEQIAQIRSELG